MQGGGCTSGAIVGSVSCSRTLRQAVQLSPGRPGIKPALPAELQPPLFPSKFAANSNDNLPPKSAFPVTVKQIGHIWINSWWHCFSSRAPFNNCGRRRSNEDVIKVKPRGNKNNIVKMINKEWYWTLDQTQNDITFISKKGQKRWGTNTWWFFCRASYRPVSAAPTAEKTSYE